MNEIILNIQENLNDERSQPEQLTPYELVFRDLVDAHNIDDGPGLLRVAQSAQSLLKVLVGRGDGCDHGSL